MAKKTDETPEEGADLSTGGPEEERDPPDEADDDGPRGRFARLTRRILEREDGRNVLSAVWETSDRARTEMIRLIAREVRTTLDALQLKEELLDLVRSHSLEVHASFRLKPLSDPPPPREPPSEGAPRSARDDDEDDADDGSR